MNLTKELISRFKSNYLILISLQPDVVDLWYLLQYVLDIVDFHVSQPNSLIFL